MIRPGTSGAAVAFSLLGLAAAWWPQARPAPKPAPNEQIVLVSGDIDGYLSPCGCTKPMLGGVRRLASAVRSLRTPGRTTFVSNGSFSGRISRQDEMKAETMAEAMAQLKADAVHFTLRDARLGSGVSESMRNLAGPNRLIASSAELSQAARVRTTDAWVIGALSSRPTELARVTDSTVIPNEEALNTLLSAAQTKRKPALILFDGPLDAAVQLTANRPGRALVVYRSGGSPPPRPTVRGKYTFVTAGERGKSMLRLRWANGALTGYQVVPLGPSFANDPAVSRTYATYLDRVGDAKLIERLPRKNGPAFAGTPRCASCHTDDAAKHETTAHAQALATLEREGHDRDPDCVGCHVVGLDQKNGFQDRVKTPDLADVGCESCHGPGLAHSNSPLAQKMGKVGEASCQPCHVPEHSPEFKFLTYWPQISHGLGKTRGKVTRNVAFFLTKASRPTPAP